MLAGVGLRAGRTVETQKGRPLLSSFRLPEGLLDSPAGEAASQGVWPLGDPNLAATALFSSLASWGCHPARNPGYPFSSGVFPLAAHAW
jgi:hypothetical protein